MNLKLFTFLPLILASYFTKAQIISSSLEELIDAEINFCKEGEKSTLRDAFIKNMADKSVAFLGGKVTPFAKALAEWPEGPDAGKIIWYPVFADISESEDIGFTTGPLMYYATKTDSVPVSTIIFNSVWVKNEGQGWKVMADLGTGKYDYSNIPTSVSTSVFPKNKNNKQESCDSFLAMDKAYCVQLNKSKRSFEEGALTNESRIHHLFNFPVVGKPGISELKEENLEYYDFEMVDGGLSKSGDFGYAYGELKVDIKGEKPRTMNVCYLRVWKRVEGQWRISLDVIG